MPPSVSGDKAAIFHSLLSLEGRSFSQADVEEAVQSCRDLPSALKYLSHECPICREQVSFSKVGERLGPPSNTVNMDPSLPAFFEVITGPLLLGRLK